MLFELIILCSGQDYDSSTRIDIVGVYSFLDCNWINCQTNGHGGCIFFSSAGSKLTVKRCSFVRGECIGSEDRAGGICFMDCVYVTIELTCFYYFY